MKEPGQKMAQAQAIRMKARGLFAGIRTPRSIPNLCYRKRVFTMMPAFGQISVYLALRNRVYIEEVGPM
jgi:hypothetical protein